MDTVPTPSEAHDLRKLFAGHPLIMDITSAIAAYVGVKARVWQVAAALPLWVHYDQLTERESRAVVAFFTPPPAQTCVRCGEPIEYVSDGPQPGWWRHGPDAATQPAQTFRQQLRLDPEDPEHARLAPHGAEPYYPPDGDPPFDCSGDCCRLGSVS